MKAIIYTSNTGYTKKYAEILSRKTGVPAYNSKSANKSLTKNDEIIYMGWLKAGTLVGFEKAQKEYTIKVICAVGMGNPDEKIVATVIKRHHIKDAKVFYLQGGFDINKLHGINKLLMKMMSKMLGSSVAKKESKSDEDLATLETVKNIKNGADWVCEENLEPLLLMNRKSQLWQTTFDHINGGGVMPKDSQPDNKKARVEKANGQTPITQENQNHNKNTKKQSNPPNDV